jgi:nicotinamide phosphoribosyltransferase
MNKENINYRTVAEYGTLKRLITEIYPSGFISVVSDTFDLWQVLTQILPRLKPEIMSRDGRVVIRPDSGDPVDIICGKVIPKFIDFTEAEHYMYGRLHNGQLFEIDGKYYSVIAHNYNDFEYEEVEAKPEYKGVVELLWDTFGGTINEKGYKVLDSHIGCIYGDAITMERSEQICSRLEAKGFASCNWVAGIGSYTYQYNTRDTFGFALKTTYVEISGVGRNIFKDPITDDGTKKSLKGLIQVFNNRPDANDDELLFDGHDDIKVKQECTKEEEKGGLLRTVFYNSMLIVDENLSDIRKRIISQSK